MPGDGTMAADTTPRSSCSSSSSIKTSKQLAAAKKAAAALRAQLHEELESKKLCAYQAHECSQLTMDGYDYCLRHILEDKNAPFRQCGYVFGANKKRCHLPAAKEETKDFGYCMEHALKTHLSRIRTSLRTRPPQSPESLLVCLKHHVKHLKSRAHSVNHANNASLDEVRSPTPENDVKMTKHIDPFVDCDAMVLNATCSDILEQASESESDVEPTHFSEVWHDAHADSSDNESIDSEQEDPLKHAGIYTAEEVTLVTRDKLIRLQSLYVEQLNYLEYILRERRRKYLQALKREKETLSSIHDQPKDCLKEQRLYRKLKALNHYEKKFGVEAILNRRCRDLRLKAMKFPKSDPSKSSHSKCIFTIGGVKCGEKTLPVAKFCRKHILNDMNQVLYKKCGRIRADVECHEPVLSVFKDANCMFHMDMPTVKKYADMKRDDDSDVDESIETNDTPTNGTTTNGTTTNGTTTIGTTTIDTTTIDNAMNDVALLHGFPSLTFSKEIVDKKLDLTNSEMYPVDYSGESPKAESGSESGSESVKVEPKPEPTPDDEMAAILIKLHGNGG